MLQSYDSNMIVISMMLCSMLCVFVNFQSPVNSETIGKIVLPGFYQVIFLDQLSAMVTEPGSCSVQCCTLGNLIHTLVLFIIQ